MGVSSAWYGHRRVEYLGSFQSVGPSQPVHEGVHGGRACDVTGGFVGFARIGFSDLEVPPLLKALVSDLLTRASTVLCDSSTAFSTGRFPAGRASVTGCSKVWAASAYIPGRTCWQVSMVNAGFA